MVVAILGQDDGYVSRSVCSDAACLTPATLLCCCWPSVGKAVWKLDDPATMKAEQEERARQAADAAKKKLQIQLALKVCRLSYETSLRWVASWNAWPLNLHDVISGIGCNALCSWLWLRT